MDRLRDRLISRIDEALADALNQQNSPNTLLQLEASLILPQDTADHVRRVVLDTINIDELRQSTARSATIPTHTELGLGRFAVVNPTNGQLPNTLPPILLPPFVPNGMVSGTSLDQDDARHINGPQQIPGNATPVVALGMQHSPAQNGTSKSIAATDCNATNDKRKRPPVDRLIEGIWEQIHQSQGKSGSDRDQDEIASFLKNELITNQSLTEVSKEMFEQVTRRCRRVTAGGRTARSVEVVVQADWMDKFDARLQVLKDEQPHLKLQEHKKIVMSEACAAFSWSEKELRNRTAVWKGYREIKQAAGWTALVFAGSGIYRYCKYRQGFDDDAMHKLKCMRIRAEVAADTIQPQWREILALTDDSTAVNWTGHPHDWTVSLKENEDPLPLPLTYKQWDANFTFEHLSESRIDTEQYGIQDPRQFEYGPEYYCRSCTQRQSMIQEENLCECFPDIYGPNARMACPVQIFRTENGKNNGLIACCAFDAGKAVGEFLGLITKGLADVDVMQSQAGDNEPYQIWQGRCGNFTRFINHSCASNCAFQTFSWMGVQRIVVVSKGVAAGEELTVDYSNHYWDNLDKICLCGEPCCRFKDRRKAVAS